LYFLFRYPFSMSFFLCLLQSVSPCTKAFDVD
jgi:hypothetical protein